MGDDRIYLEVNPVIRSVNNARGITTSFGFVPGFDEQRIRTAAEIMPGHALVVAMPSESQTLLFVVVPKLLPPSVESRANVVAKKLAEKYHAACARGDAGAAREFALLALDLNPLSLALPELKKVVLRSEPADGTGLGNVELLPARHTEPPARKP